MKPFRQLALGLIVIAIAATSGLVGHRLYRYASAPKVAHVERVPDFTLPDLDGKPRRLSEWRGRPLLINFWATWCGPCRREIPLLKKIRADYASQGLEVIGIAVDFRDPVAAYVSKAKIEYPNLIAADNTMVTSAFGVGMGLPVTVFAGRDGRIVAVKVGQLHAERAEKLIRQVLEAP